MVHSAEVVRTDCVGHLALHVERLGDVGSDGLRLMFHVDAVLVLVRLLYLFVFDDGFEPKCFVEVAFVLLLACFNLPLLVFPVLCMDLALHFDCLSSAHHVESILIFLLLAPFLFFLHVFNLNLARYQLGSFLSLLTNFKQRPDALVWISLVGRFASHHFCCLHVRSWLTPVPGWRNILHFEVSMVLSKPAHLVCKLIDTFRVGALRCKLLDLSW